MTDLCPRIAGSVRALARSLLPRRRLIKTTRANLFLRCHRQPQREVERLFTFLGRPHDDRVHGDLRQPSRQSRRDSAVVPGGDPLRHWRRFVGPADIQRAEEILTLFGLDGLYDHEGLPVPGMAENVGPAGFGLERRDSG